MNKRFVLWSITVGLGGFLFGLDAAVIPGAFMMVLQLLFVWKMMPETKVIALENMGKRDRPGSC